LAHPPWKDVVLRADINQHPNWSRFRIRPETLNLKKNQRVYNIFCLKMNGKRF